MKHISRVLLITCMAFLLAGFTAYADSFYDPLAQNTYDFSTDTIFDETTWCWNGGDGVTPYITDYSKYGKIGLTNKDGSHVYTPDTFNVGVSDGTFKVNGDTFVYNRWTRDFGGFEQTKVDVKFNFASRESSEGFALVKLFGYNAFTWQASNEQANSYGNIPNFGDSGLVFINGGLYTIADIGDGKVAAMKSLGADDNNYTQLLSSVYTNNVLTPGTLTDDTWYTVERIVDMRESYSDPSNKFMTQMQKIKITEKATGDVIVVTDWIPAGYTNTSNRQLQTSLLAFTKGFKTGDVIELDNYSQAKLTGPSPLEYVFEEGTADYLETGILTKQRPDSVTFLSGDKLCGVTSENVVLKNGNVTLDNSYYTVEPTGDGKGFVLSFNKDLEFEQTYNLTITGLMYEDLGLPVEDCNHTFLVLSFAVTNSGFVNEAGAPLNSNALNIGDTVKYKATIAQTMRDEIDFMVVVALYNANNQLLDITGEWGKLGRDPISISTDAMEVTESGCHAEVFIFDNIKNMRLKKY